MFHERPAWRDFSRLGRGSGYYRKGAFVSKFTMDFQRGYYLPTKDGPVPTTAHPPFHNARNAAQVHFYV